MGKGGEKGARGLWVMGGCIWIYVGRKICEWMEDGT